MLKTLVLKRFKKFQETKVIFEPFTILMGENSSGKTTIIQAINLALNMFYRYNLISDDNNVLVNIRKKGVGLSILPGMNISDFRELYYSKISRGPKTKNVVDGSIGAVIELIDSYYNIYRLQISSLFGSFNLKCISEISELSNGPSLHRYAPLFISGFVGLRSTEERSFPVAIQDRLVSGEVSTIIRNIVLDTKKYSPEKYKLLKNRLEKDFGFFLEEALFDENKDICVTAHYSEICGNNRLSLDFNSSGSGFMQVLQILTPIYRFCPEHCRIVLLDEPDAHLHSNLQSTLAKTLRDIQKELNIQIIISTHSTSIIRSANPNEVIPISFNSKENVPLSTEEDVEQQIIGKIDTYDLGKSVISGKLIFFEDSNLDIIEMFDKVLKTNCFSGANTVPVLSGRGKDDKVPYYLSDILKNFLKKDIEIHFVRDGDGLNNEWRSRLKEYSSQNKVILHHLERHEIENYILNADLLLRTLLKKHPDKELPTIEVIENKIKEYLKDTILMAKYHYEDNLEDSIYKTALLLSKPEYRNPQLSKSEAISIRDSYEKYTSLNDLLVAGMGKEALKCVLRWLNDELRLNLSKSDIITCIEEQDIIDEIRVIMAKIQSKEQKPMPSTLPLFEIEDEEEE